MEPRLGIYFDKSSFYGGARLSRGRVEPRESEEEEIDFSLRRRREIDDVITKPSEAL